MSNDPSNEMIKEAENLGIDVDKRWSKDTLQHKINDKKAEKAKEVPEIVREAPAQQQPQSVNSQTNLGVSPAPAFSGSTRDPQPPEPKKGETPIRLKADVWFQDDVRTTAGAVVKVDVETAKRLIAADKAERADPLPGE